MNNDKSAILTQIKSILNRYDKALLEAYLENHCKAKTISKLTSLDQRKVYRKISNIKKRLSNVNSKMYYRHRSQFNAIERKILKLHYKDGLNKKQIAAGYNFTRYRIYKTLRKLEQFNNNTPLN